MNERGLLAGHAKQADADADSELAQLYRDGMFVAAWRKANRLFPFGSRRREALKKLGKRLVR